MSSKAAVNHPMNTKQKEQDINQKLQLFGIYQAFKNGKLPSNKQCDVALNTALQHKALSSPSKELSTEGQGLVQDLRDVINNAKKLMLSKNDGQLLQEFLWEAQNISAEDTEKPGVPVTKDAAQQDAQESIEGLKTLGRLLITNGEFRKLLNDAMILARDMAGDMSQKASDRLRPSQDQLDQIDEPAEENVWHEQPDFSQQKEQFKSRFKKNKEEGKQDVTDTAAQAATGGQQPQRVSDVDPRAGVTAGAQRAQELVSDNVPEEQKDRAREYRERTKNYLSEKMPQERRDQAIWRLKKMVIEIQGHSDYQQAIRTLLSMAEKYGSHTRNLSQQGAGSVQGFRSGDKIQKMETNLRTLLERFANSTSLDNLFDSLDNIYRDADRDPELKGWFRNMDTFIRKTLTEQGYIMEDDCTRQWNQLNEHGRYLLRDRYKDHTDRILDEIKFIGDQFNQDPQNLAFRSSLEKLFEDLGRDSSGNVAFKKHLLKDIRDVILPAAFENVRYVPVPRIEVSDPSADVVVENLVIESDNLMPNVVEFGSDNYFRWGRKKISSKRDNKIMISVSGIQADLRDVSYYINRKQGFPAITDTGIMDIFLGGEGFGFKIAASTAQKEDSQHYIKLDKVSVKIDSFNVKLKKSKHKALFTIFKPLLFRVVRPTLQKVIEQQIRDAFAKGDALAYEIQSRVNEAKEASREDPANAPNIYSRYLDAFRARGEEKARKAQAQAQAAAQRGTKVQTATTLHDSIFPDIKLPGGISSKATEYKELAMKGERWESPVFSIGSASESTDIPKPASISRKRRSPLEQGPTTGAGTNGSAAFADGKPTTGGVAALDGRAVNGSHALGTNGYTNGHTNGHANGHTNGHTNGYTAGTNGYSNGHSKPYDHVAASRGFSDEVNQAFGNGHTNLTANGRPTVPGAQTAFNPQTA
ncbi:uncharacterized protein BO72DRAFT_385194 [Aspergillus fijiensis CBS 313.89]|uniref:Bactericidal permeability-increasing protein n=1 Tax=Aspergillus fijiensis CBS 313.89 TaxID=1448319 RepID=A0A8G1RPD6_9EURO|nr:uncharacterized protein BO72DRAFT_385194 [Aspergillus fijiensis CBS 313.89]RAK74211.1 hypothetical protein BO72DRAFT_385194 [Aspergillus fijiensis CBS 313.89]